MTSRSIASLSLSFGLVSIPIKLYSATQSAAAIRFKLMSASGAQVRQQYVTRPPPEIREEESIEPEAGVGAELDRPASLSLPIRVVRSPVTRPAVRLPGVEEETPAASESVVERAAMLKGYEYEKGKFVLFTPEELKALESASRRTIDIVCFIPERAVDPIYYDKAYLLAPDKKVLKPYSLLHRAMADVGKCALAKWAFRSKEYVAQIRAAGGGLVLQQLFYADEVRSIGELHIEMPPVNEAEFSLAKQLIAQISADSYDPTHFVDEEKMRILEAVNAKIAGRQIAAPLSASRSNGQVIDLLQALRASLQPRTTGHSLPPLQERKPAKRAPRRQAESVRRSPKKRSGR